VVGPTRGWFVHHLSHGGVSACETVYSRAMLERWRFLTMTVLLIACDRGGEREARTSRVVASASASASASALAEGAAPTTERGERWPSRAKAESTQFTAGIVDYRPAPREVALLTDVRAASHEQFDRVVFELGKGSAPGYHLEYIDRPVRKCGSGDATAIDGDAWLQVRIEPANAHTEAGVPTISARDQKASLKVLRELEQTCDFEAQVTWVLGVAKPNRYRVLTLNDPLRLVVDIEH
jgi:hypothetical protein